MTQGYYRFPTIGGETIVFACEDDLWTVGAEGGLARRLTANPGEANHPALSPDGAWLAFTGRDEGDPEVYLMPAGGGPSRRLTFLGAARTRVVGWSPDGAEVIFSSEASRPFGGMQRLLAVPRLGGEPRELPTGPALSISFGPGGGLVIARNETDLAYWKRYRGGQTGDIWVDREGSGQWQRLTRLTGNLARPIWLGERIYFVSDHEGVGNLYSCAPDGADLRRHTDHTDFYVRHPASDGRQIIYHAGADLWVFDPASGRRRLVPIELHSPQPQRKRRFVDADDYLESFAISPSGRRLAITSRGKAFSMGCWEGAPLQHGAEEGRSRLACFLHDGRRGVLLNDASGEEVLELHQGDGSQPPRRYDGLAIGRPLALAPSPKADLLALANERHELLLIDLEAGTLRSLDRSPHGRISGLAWAPDGRWLAYSFPNTRRTSIIRICRLEDGALHDATPTMLYDTAPSWDPEGKYLYFIGARELDPIRDLTQFDWAFPRAERPFLITLRADLASPFAPQPDDADPAQKKPAPPAESAPPPEPAGADEGPGAPAEPPAEGEKPKEQKPQAPEEKARDEGITIDLQGLSQRIVAFPVAVGIYGQVLGVKGKALFTSYSIRGGLHGGPQRGTLESYDLAERSQETLLEGIDQMALSADGSTLIYRSGRRLRVLKAGEKPKENGGTTRKSGWIDLDRIRLAILPPLEWRQMYREAWRLQRDQFWSEDMSGIDWQGIYLRYLPLLGRVATRSEFTDLIWEMQGELGTSHAYAMGGDLRRPPSYDQGFLGADLRYDQASDSYVVERILAPDPWDERACSPLARPGVNVAPGDRLLAINGRRVGLGQSPGELLVHQAGAELLLTIGPAGGGDPRSVTVRAMGDEHQLRYRDWVERNRAAVHLASAGRLGYVHIPNMGVWGYAEFHRLFLPESTRDGLIIDLRYNGGGNVSQLLLEKLARKRLGYDVSRWGQPDPYPADSVGGPIVAITNEWAGSDGDIFSHVFKLMGLGPLVGTRTWGGVIGINPVGRLADGGMTTQPEYSFWFPDVGWGVENYGTDPTIPVENAPHDYVAGRDPQLERAIAEALGALEARPPQLPEFGPRPRLAPPAMPE